MKWLSRFLAVLIGTVLFRSTKDFFSRYDVLVFDKEDVDEAREHNRSGHIDNLRPENYDSAIDFRGTPSHVCVCGSEIWNLKVVFQDHEIATYFLDMECANCGSLATAPTPIDREI